MPAIYVPITHEEVEELRRLAAREMRPAKEQARYLIVDGLRRAAQSVPETASKSHEQKP